MMAKNRETQESLFKRLTRLFRSGPVIKRKIRTADTMIAVPDREKSSGALLFQKSLSPTYATITSNAYNLSERLMRYQDFQEMEYTAELAAALDIYADETVASDDKGRVLHIYSDNPKIKSLLQDLFYNTLNVEFNMRSWVRNLCKFGDFFLYNDVSPENGVINAFPIPVNEIEREENYDRADPSAVRFRWVTLGNRILENWEISHFRLLGNDMFLPYGSSIIEPARRIWRQLILIEDAMLVYRVVRAPERRVFYIDVGGMPAEAVTPYVEEQKRALKSSQVIDRTTGRVDLRYNPLSVDEDYFIAVRGGDSGTKIDTLAGGQNAAAVEDVQYIQKKLFAALKIPKAYLGYDEALSSKATLAQEDIRFSRTISVIQKTIIAELNKLAIIHLYSNGYDSDDLLNFTLRLSNPSTVAQQQKLELWRSKFDIASTGIADGLTSKSFVRREILGLNDEDIEKLDKERYEEKIIENAIEEAAPGGDTGGGGGGGGGGGFGGGGGGGGGDFDLGDDIFGDEGGDEGDEVGDEEGGETEEEEPENAGPEEEEGVQLLTSNEDDEDVLMQTSSRSRSPVNVNPIVRDKQKRQEREYRDSRRQRPDFKMPSIKGTLSPRNTRSSRQPWKDNSGDKDTFRELVTNPLGESAPVRPTLSSDIIKMLRGMSASRGVGATGGLLSEEFDLDITGEDER